MSNTEHTAIRVLELLTVKEAAEVLRVHHQTVRRRIRSGELPAVQLGGRGSTVRVDAAELDGWLYRPKGDK